MADETDAFPPKVAQILYSGLGGHAGVAFGIADGDPERSWRNAFGFVGVEPLLPAYAERAEAAGIEHAYVPAVPRRPWSSWRGLHRWLRETRPSAILLHSPSLLLPCLRYSRSAKIPLIVVEHQPNHLKTRQDWGYSRLSMLLADRVVLLSEEYRAVLEARLRGFFRPAKIAIIPNGIDVGAFSGAEPFAGGRGPLKIGMAARFTTMKLFPLLIDAAERLQAADPGLDFSLSLAGSGEEWERVRSRAAASPIAAKIVLEGMVYNEALVDWYRGLDVYCHISAGETLPMSVVQAMSAGLPIVGSDVPGIDNLLGGQPPAGLLVPNEAGAITEALSSFVASPQRARELGAAARAKAVREFSQVTTFRRYDSLLPKAP